MRKCSVCARPGAHFNEYFYFCVCILILMFQLPYFVPKVCMSLGLRRTAADSFFIDGSDTFSLSLSLFLANLLDSQKQESQHKDKINLARTKKKMVCNYTRGVISRSQATRVYNCRPGVPLKCRRRLS